MNRYHFLEPTKEKSSRISCSSDLLTTFGLSKLYELKDVKPDLSDFTGAIVGSIDYTSDRSLQSLLANPPPLRKISPLTDQELQRFNYPPDEQFDAAAYGFDLGSEEMEDEIEVVEPKKEKIIIKLGRSLLNQDLKRNLVAQEMKKKRRHKSEPEDPKKRKKV